MLMMAKNLPQTAFRAIAPNRVSDGCGGGHHADSRTFRDHRGRGRELGRTFGRGGWFGGALKVPKREAAAIDATASFTRRAKIQLPTQSLLGAETHGANRS